MKDRTLLVKLFYKKDDGALAIKKKILHWKMWKKAVIRSLLKIWWKLFRNSKRQVLLKWNLVKGSMSVDVVLQEGTNSDVQMHNAWRIARFLDLWVWNIKFYSMSCIAVHTKLPMFRSCFLQVRHTFALKFLVRIEMDIEWPWNIL